MLHICYSVISAVLLINCISALKCQPISNNERFDCHPDADANPDRCESRGCCWNVPNQVENDPNKIDIPFCFFPLDYEGYSTEGQLQGDRAEADGGFFTELTRPKGSLSGWPNDIPKLRFDIKFETRHRVHFKLYDADRPRYEVPLELGRDPIPGLVDYGVSMSPAPFQFAIFRKSTGVPLFNSWITSSPLIFADQFVQWSTLLPTPRLYGLGEHVAPFLHKLDRWRQLAFWSRDIAPRTNSNLYGVHPFYIGAEKDGQSFGVFLLNSNAMEVDLQPLPALTFRTIGGVLDFYVFMGPTYDDVVQQYAHLIGHTFLPPYWSLGFHLCRYDYGNDTAMQRVIERTKATGIPYDVQWNDIDYMDHHKDFSFSPVNYSRLPEIVDQLHKDGMKYIMIVDPGISSKSTTPYPAYDKGVEYDIFIKNDSKQILIGEVWPGQSVFPDFSHPNAGQWWYEQTKAFHDKIPFDGLWTDMNEPSNFVDGSIHGCTNNLYDKPPYVPGIMNGALHVKTICPSARHFMYRDYDIHSMYGHYEAIASSSAMNRITGQRSIVISRSTFASTGRYAGHWSGDVGSTWQDLYYSIPVMLNFQVFGIPFVGADVCGFLFDTTEELCIRWTQLGSFYPFMRNHNDRSSIEQDPGVFSADAQRGMREAVKQRYTLLPLLYTLLWKSNATGSPVVRPLVAQYPTDETVFGIDRQFLWGNSIMACPILTKGATNVSCYFPHDVWFDVTAGNRRPSSLVVNSDDGGKAGDGVKVGEGYKGGFWKTFESPLYSAPLVFQRGGTVVPRQMSANNTALARKNTFHFSVAFDGGRQSVGELYFDDGHTFDHVHQSAFVHLSIFAKDGYLSTTLLRNNYSEERMDLCMIELYGLTAMPTSAGVNTGSKVKIQGDIRTKVLLKFETVVSLRSKLEITWK